MSNGIHLVLEALGPVRKSGSSWSAVCPAHPDNNPSLSISEGETQPVILHCHAGCTPEEILEALHLTWAEVCAEREERPKGEWTPFGDAVAVYDYVDEDGKLLFQVLRTADKQFPQRRPAPEAKSGWTWKLGDVRKVLYRLPRLPDAIAAGERIFVVEGEKDVQAIEAVGEIATCTPGGAGKWRAEYAEHLRDAHVVVVADKDRPGEKHARTVAAGLADVAASVQVCEPKDGKDAADHLAAGHGLEDLLVISTGDDVREQRSDPDLHQFLAEVDEYDWVVPGLLERGDRLMLTGFPGLGKSELQRQIAVCLAAGLHPFAFTPTAPVKVVYVDCENGKMHMRRRLRPLERWSTRSGHRVPDGGLIVLNRPEGLDLLGDDDPTWLVERVLAHKPEVLFVGPLYRLHLANPNDEMPVRRVLDAIDAARTAVNCAVIIEAHAGHGDSFAAKSPVRPSGASITMRWPEFGYGIRAKTDSAAPHGHEVDFVSWRGPRDERAWPDELHRGSTWPWEGVWHQGMPTYSEGAA